MRTDEASSEKQAAPATGTQPPRSGPRPPLPRSSSYGVKRAILGRALPTAHLVHERLGKIAALAIFSSDALSSVAYATEEMLKTLAIAGVGILMFSLIVPLSAAIVGVLAILVFSYRQTIKAYPSAGGAYIVTKDNFGLIPAQVAGVALLTDYVLTVAVSVSAGVAAVVALAPATAPWRVEMAVVFVILIAYGNLRGVRESGRLFSIPTYVFIASVLVMIAIGAVRLATGSLVAPTEVLPAGSAGLLAGVPLFVALHALASGSTAMTGVEAISNGVPAFRPVEWKNARKVLGWLGVLLGTMFIGISFLAWKLHPIPSTKETVISQIARAVVGTGTIGNIAFFVIQAMTMLILVLAANTSFADFPRLASFHAHDHFLPSPLTKRGRRLVFANGIVVLAGLATLVTLAFGASVSRLIPLYAIGVFTSFTLSQGGMAKRHLTLNEQGWKTGLWVNGTGAVATGVVGIVIAVTKFTHGAWIIMVIVPVTVAVLVRVNKHYDHVASKLDEPDPALAIAAVKRLAAVVLVSRVDDGL